MKTVADVVAADLCIGCGLCAAVTGGRVEMVMTSDGGLRPSPADGFSAAEEQTILTACPGVVAEARPDQTVDGDKKGPTLDPIWGHHRSMFLGWAGDPTVRHEAATGGVLTALGCSLLERGEVTAVLHVGADPAQPMRSRWVLSTTAESVKANASSRYGPTAPLAGLIEALDRGEPFAVIAKPCDLGAVHRYGTIDSRVDELCVARLALVCGGQSRLGKSKDVLESFGLSETEVTLFRYRGNGNPGPTRVETADGRSFEKSYLEMWEDESGWELETRCKLCPDALGEAADVSAADAWPGGAPTGEDKGFNAVVVRTAAGQRFVEAAIAGGALVEGGELSSEDLNDMQPHQVRKKVALVGRFQGVADAGISPITTIGLRIDELGRRSDAEATATQRAGTAQRMRARIDDVT